jgi:hypothetical protein
LKIFLLQSYYWFSVYLPCKRSTQCMTLILPKFLRFTLLSRIWFNLISVLQALVKKCLGSVGRSVLEPLIGTSLLVVLLNSFLMIFHLSSWSIVQGWALKSPTICEFFYFPFKLYQFCFTYFYPFCLVHTHLGLLGLLAKFTLAFSNIVFFHISGHFHCSDIDLPDSHITIPVFHWLLFA